MAFSLSNWFKGKPGTSATDPDAPAETEGNSAAPVAPAAPTAPPPAVRTVMPNSAQPVNLREPAARPPVTLTNTARPAAAPAPKVSPVLPPGRKISFAPPAAMPVSVAQPASYAAPSSAPMSFASSAAAMQAPDATVVLEIGDFIDRLPPGLSKMEEVDRHRIVEFRAEELYADLTKGRATVPASIIYAKCPDIFSRPVTETEDAEVSLPLQKLVEQLSAALHTRNDQVEEENVGEIETPFLQVAMEDSARLPRAAGTNAGAVRPTVRATPAAPEIPAADDTGLDLPVRPAHRTGQISTISPLKPTVEPPLAAPTAAAVGPINPGKRPPSTVRASVAGGKIRLSGPANVTRIVPGASVPPAPVPSAQAGLPPRPSTASQRIQLPTQTASPSHQVSKKTARIQIPPISLRPGGPGATPRPGGVTPPSVPVQPSPVTIRPPSAPESPISFRSAPPPPTAKIPPPSFAPSPRPAIPPLSVAVPPAAAPTPAPEPPAAPDDRQISLGLAAVLRGQPSEALAVEPSSVPDDVRFTLPFAMVEKQLTQGRVTIGREVFLAALPEAHRSVLAEEDTLPEIQIPLQEVFQNLPSNALSMRADQVVEETGTYYPTPFSQKADEDAQRFAAPAAVVPPEAVAEPMAEPAVENLAPPAAAPTVEQAPVSEEPVVEQPSAEAQVEPPSLVEDPAPTLEEPPTEQPAESRIDQPLPDLEEAPAMEETAPEAFRDESAASTETSAEPTTSPTTEPPKGKKSSKGRRFPATTEVPAEPVVEPPAMVDPAPVEEALAVLESTAPIEPPAEETAKPEATSNRQEVSVEPPAAEPPAAPIPAVPAAAPAAPRVKASGDSELQTLFMTEEELDAKTIVRLVSQLPGINQCAVVFADGLHLAGNFPVSDTEAFGAMAPPFFKRTQNFVSELKLGVLQTFTLHTDTGLLSFFMHDAICVSVSHTGRGFLPGVREKLEVVTRELARMYATTTPADSTDASI